MALATITHGGKMFQFRTNPNSIRWTYTLNTKVEETYGGRVVQILSANIDDLVVVAEAGGGGWEYLHAAGLFMRDMMFDQRSGGEPGVFSYPTRGWEMSVYAVSFPFKDAWNEVKREFTMSFKVQEDVNGVVSSEVISGEIERLKKGIAYEHNDFNTPPGDAGTDAWPTFGGPNDTAPGNALPGSPVNGLNPNANSAINPTPNPGFVGGTR